MRLERFVLSRLMLTLPLTVRELSMSGQRYRAVLEARAA